MSTGKLIKANTAMTDLATEKGVPVSQRIASLHALKRHVDGLIRKLEGEKPNPVSQVGGD